MTHPVEAIASFMSLGGQVVPDDVDNSITPEEIHPFIDRVDEESDETYVASGYSYAPGEHGSVNMPEVLDGFIDIAYAALTGAVRVVGVEKAKAAWDAVVDANLSKVDGRYGPPIINPETGKIGKPEGWIAPDIEAIINN